MADTGVSRETCDRLQRIVDVLGDWRLRTNLIGPAEWDRVWRRHVLDSVQLLPLLPETGQILDLGSGAGFPGLVIAACRPAGAGDVILVESVGKKCAFLRAAIEAAMLPAQVRQVRVESLPYDAATAVMARAFAPLPKLLDYAAPWLEAGAIGVFPKGERWQEELTAAQKQWKFAQEVIPSRTSDRGAILKLSEVARAQQDPDSRNRKSKRRGG
jgi:16S rRNA (guanine527-N7)-methyltransferase